MNLTLRQWLDSDANALSTHANNEKVAKNLRDGFPHPYTLEDARSFIEMCQDLDPATGDFRAIDIDGESVGGIGLTFGADVHRHTAELGYWLGEAYWGRGIVTQAVTQLCREAFARTGLLRIFAMPYASNPASDRVLEKAGFVWEGTLRRHALKQGELLDCHIYGLLKQG